MQPQYCFESIEIEVGVQQAVTISGENRRDQAINRLARRDSSAAQGRKL